MARTGVSYTEVSKAATQLVGEGRNPTVEQVRILLGTGSSTTIANHLRQWRANQEATTLVSAKENIPPELVAIMKGLWERVNSHAQEKVTELEIAHQSELIQLQQEAEKYKINNQRWQKLYDQWLAEKNQLANEQLTLEQALEFSHKENISLHAKQDALMQQLHDKQERNEELNRLHKQTQANLEHYREAAREQRLLDQQQFDNQKQQLQLEIKTLNEQYIMQREKMLAAQQQFMLLQQNYSAIEKNHEAAQVSLELINKKLDAAEKTKNEFINTSQHWQDQYKESQQSLNAKANQLIDSQVEIKTLTQQLTDAKQIFADVQNQNKLLNHEKWTLAQEKAQLVGQLKQMQAMLVT